MLIKNCNTIILCKDEKELINLNMNINVKDDTLILIVDDFECMKQYLGFKIKKVYKTDTCNVSEKILKKCIYSLATTEFKEIENINEYFDENKSLMLNKDCTIRDFYNESIQELKRLKKKRNMEEVSK